MKPEMPLVTCVMPSYKRSDMIIRAIDSVLAQTYPNIEILVVDDNENGDAYSLRLREVVEAYGKPNVRVLIQPRHINGAAARNYGIRNAMGDFIAFLDDDDEWLPEKIEKQVSFLQSNPDFDGVSTLLSIYTKGELISTSKPYSEENLQFNVFLRKVKILTSTFMARREALLEIGGFDEALRRHQDLQLFISFLENHRIGLVPENLTRLHSDSEINRPDTKSFIEIKKAFFNSVKNIFEKYTKSQRHRIIRAHNYETAFVALKEKRYFTVMKYILKSGVSPVAIRDLMNRIKER